MTTENGNVDKLQFEMKPDREMEGNESIHDLEIAKLEQELGVEAEALEAILQDLEGKDVDRSMVSSLSEKVIDLKNKIVDGVGEKYLELAGLSVVVSSLGAMTANESVAGVKNLENVASIEGENAAIFAGALSVIWAVRKLTVWLENNSKAEEASIL